jgi:hypothetical protein
MTTTADDRVRTEYCLVSLGIHADCLSTGEIADALGVPRPAGDHSADPQPPGILFICYGARGATIADAVRGYRDALHRLAGLELAGFGLRTEVILGLHAGAERRCAFSIQPTELRLLGRAGCTIVVDAFPPPDDCYGPASNGGLKYFSVTPWEPGYRGRGGYLTSARDSSTRVISHLIHGRLVSALRADDRSGAIHIAYAADNGRGGFRIASEVVRACAADNVGIGISLFPPP